MVSPLTVPCLQELELVPTDSGDDHIIWFDDITKFLREKRSAEDTKKIRSDTIWNELRGYRNGTRSENGLKQVTLSGLLRYLFRHSEDSRSMSRQLWRSGTDCSREMKGQFEVFTNYTAL